MKISKNYLWVILIVVLVHNGEYFLPIFPFISIGCIISYFIGVYDGKHDNL